MSVWITQHVVTTPCVLTSMDLTPAHASMGTTQQMARTVPTSMNVTNHRVMRTPLALTSLAHLTVHV